MPNHVTGSKTAPSQASSGTPTYTHTYLMTDPSSGCCASTLPRLLRNTPAGLSGGSCWWLKSDRMSVWRSSCSVTSRTWRGTHKGGAGVVVWSNVGWRLHAQLLLRTSVGSAAAARGNHQHPPLPIHTHTNTTTHLEEQRRPCCLAHQAQHLRVAQPAANPGCGGQEPAAEALKAAAVPLSQRERVLLFVGQAAHTQRLSAETHNQGLLLVSCGVGCVPA